MLRDHETTADLVHAVHRLPGAVTSYVHSSSHSVSEHPASWVQPRFITVPRGRKTWDLMHSQEGLETLEKATRWEFGVLRHDMKEGRSEWISPLFFSFADVVVL